MTTATEKKIRKPRRKKVKTITLIARRWFDRVNGNTYHNCEIVVNGERVGETGFQYGYGNHYETTSGEWLEKNGFLKFKLHEHYRESLNWRYCEDNKIKFVASHSDVGRKKDL